MRTYWVLVIVVAVAAAGVFGWSHLARAAGTETGVAIPTPNEPNPIVSVVVGNSETEYEQDPFDQERLRRSTTRVKSLLYVRADGRVETKQIQ